MPTIQAHTLHHERSILLERRAPGYTLLLFAQHKLIAVGDYKQFSTALRRAVKWLWRSAPRT